MTVSEIVRQGFHYARTCKSLWLFGFFVGIASGGSSGSGGAGGGGGTGGDVATIGALPYILSITQISTIIVAVLVVALVSILLRFIGEGALIEGVVRARQGGRMTIREGFRAGWSHWGVLLRIALIYFAATIGSVALLIAVCVIAFRSFGLLGGLTLGIPALVVAVPWLISLYLVQAFAGRIAVLENRRALDAMQKARLFLHGRIMHGLKLIVATFVGTLLFVLAGLVVMVPAVLLLVALVPVLRLVPVLIIGSLLLLPVIYVLTAMLGTLRSSIWTIGYVTQVEA